MYGAEFRNRIYYLRPRKFAANRREFDLDQDTLNDRQVYLFE